MASLSLESIAKRAMLVDLSGDDITRLTGRSPIIYSDLKNYTSFKGLMGTWGFAVILYQTSSKTTGHWVATMVNNRNEIVYFDSYGLHFDTEQQKGAKYDIALPTYLTNLIEKDGRVVKINGYDYQKWSPRVSTCGRWSSIAIKLLPHITLDEFRALFTSNQSSVLNQPDFSASLLTLLSVGDIVKNIKS
jgi:hypothetical protein